MPTNIDHTTNIHHIDTINILDHHNTIKNNNNKPTLPLFHKPNQNEPLHLHVNIKQNIIKYQDQNICHQHPNKHHSLTLATQKIEPTLTNLHIQPSQQTTRFKIKSNIYNNNNQTLTTNKQISEHNIGTNRHQKQKIIL